MEKVVAHLFPLIFHSFHPSEADYLVPEQLSYYGVRLLALRLITNLEDQGIPLRLAPTLWLVRHGDTTSSYATAGIALRVSGALKPHHHNKVETPSMLYATLQKKNRVCLQFPPAYEYHRHDENKMWWISNDDVMVYVTKWRWRILVPVVDV
jgi:hypothetical protein